jgi:hypothetical protein
MRSANESTCPRDSCSSAPGTTTMRFTPDGSTRIGATIVAPFPITASASTPSESQSAAASCPNASSPIAVRKSTSAPSRAHPIAWFEPLPP